MKTIIYLLSLIFYFSHYSLAQIPEILIDEEFIKKNKISELYLIRDSININRKLSIDTIKYIRFDSFGRKIYESWSRFDISTKKTYKYFSDSIKTTKVDSSYGGLGNTLEIVKSRVIKKYKDNRLIQEKVYPYKNKLAWTTSYQYYPNGLIQLEKRIHEFRGFNPHIQTYHLVSQPELKNLLYKKLDSSKYISTVEYFYNKNKQLKKVTKTIYKSSNNEIKVQYNIFYTHESNKKTITYESEKLPIIDFNNDWTEYFISFYDENRNYILYEYDEFRDTDFGVINRFIKKQVMFYNQKKQKTKILILDDTEQVMSATYYNYFENGLLKNIMHYYSENDFGFRVKYYYKTK